MSASGDIAIASAMFSACPFSLRSPTMMSLNDMLAIAEQAFDVERR